VRMKKYNYNLDQLLGVFCFSTLMNGLFVQTASQIEIPFCVGKSNRKIVTSYSILQMPPARFCSIFITFVHL